MSTRGMEGSGRVSKGGVRGIEGLYPLDAGSERGRCWRRNLFKGGDCESSVCFCVGASERRRDVGSCVILTRPFRINRPNKTPEPINVHSFKIFHLSGFILPLSYLVWSPAPIPYVSLAKSVGESTHTINATDRRVRHYLRCSLSSPDIHTPHPLPRLVFQPAPSCRAQQTAAVVIATLTGRFTSGIT